MKNDLTRFPRMEIISGGKWGLLIGVSLDTTMAQSKGATAARAAAAKSRLLSESFLFLNGASHLKQKPREVKLNNVASAFFCCWCIGSFSLFVFARCATEICITLRISANETCFVFEHWNPRCSLCHRVHLIQHRELILITKTARLHSVPSNVTVLREYSCSQLFQGNNEALFEIISLFLSENATAAVWKYMERNYEQKFQLKKCNFSLSVHKFLTKFLGLILYMHY